MHNVRKITDDLYWVGGDEHRLHLFENIHPISRGVSYNSYLLLDKKTVLFDTVDWAIGRQFIENIKYVLKDRKLEKNTIVIYMSDNGTRFGYSQDGKQGYNKGYRGIKGDKLEGGHKLDISL